MNIQKKFAVFFVFVSLMIIGCKSNSNQTTARKKIEIKAPIPGLEAKFEEFTVDNNKNQVITTKSGTKITIPANALVDENGKPIEGAAKLKYREYHDVADILLSGIPMNFDSGGVKKNMQTAGMFDIRAEQNGAALGIAKDKKVDVRMVSFENGTDYNVFRFDEGGKGWEFLDYNKNIEVNTEKEKLRKKLEKKNPTMAFPLDEKYFTFDYFSILDVMFNDDYSKIIKNEKNPAVAQKVREYGLMWLNSACYELIKFQGVEMVTCMMVWKRNSGNNFPSWLKNDIFDHVQLSSLGGNIYQVKIEEEETKKTYSAVIEAVMPISSLLRNTPEYWKKNYEAGMAKVQEEMKQLKFEADVYRSFEIDKFGLYNYDKLLKEDNAVKVIANFKTDIKDDSLNNVFYIVDNKTIITLDKNSWGKIKLIPNSTGRFVAIINGKAVCIFSQEEYAKIDFENLRKQDNPKFDITLSKKEIVNSPEDVKKLLNL